MTLHALLIDYDYCYGCHTCEVACQKEHDYDCDVRGITVQEIGPFQYKELGKTVYDFIPVPTDLCDMCARRLAKGKEPSCVHHCQSGCMKFGTLEEMQEVAARKSRQVLFVR